MINFIYFIYLIIYHKSFISSKIQLNFKRRIISNLNKENIIKALKMNDIYTNIKIGNPQQEIPITLKLQKNEFYIISNQSNYNKSKVFSEKLSKSFQRLKHIDVPQPEEIYQGELSTENIQFDNNNIINNLTFFLGIELSKYRNIYEGGSIGLKIHFENFEILKGMNLVNNLKLLNIIDSYSFSLKFDKEDNLELIIGNLPHEYDKKYSEEKLKKTNAIYFGGNPEWILNFEEIKYNNKTFNNFKKFWLYPELGVIISTSEFRDYMNQTFFQKYISQGICFQNLYNDTVEFDKYYYFYCKDTLNPEIFGNISFYHKDFNYTFIIEFKDLFYKLGNLNYFLILFPTILTVEWKLGLPFFRKYDFVFDMDKKFIGFYIGKSGFSLNLWIILFFVLLIIVIIMGFIIYFLLNKKPRKIRVNELDEQYEYLTNN